MKEYSEQKERIGKMKRFPADERSEDDGRPKIKSEGHQLHPSERVHVGKTGIRPAAEIGLLGDKYMTTATAEEERHGRQGR
jgi:hypothetical protein